jgi:hypothetical protein
MWKKNSQLYIMFAQVNNRGEDHVIGKKEATSENVEA